MPVYATNSLLNAPVLISLFTSMLGCMLAKIHNQHSILSLFLRQKSESGLQSYEKLKHPIQLLTRIKLQSITLSICACHHMTALGLV